MSYEKIKETGNDDLWTFPCQITSRKYNSIQQNKCGVFLYCSAMMKKAQVKHQWAGHSSPRSTSVYHILSLKQPIFFQFSCPNLNYRMMNNCYLFFFYPDQCIVLFWISYFDLRELQVITEIADNSFAESAFKYATLITGKKKKKVILQIFTIFTLTAYSLLSVCWSTKSEQDAVWEMVLMAVAATGLACPLHAAALPAWPSSVLPPDTAGSLPVQAPEYWWADDQRWGLHLRQPNAAVWSQRRLGHRDLAPDWVQGFSSWKLHRESQRVRHVG